MKAKELDLIIKEGEGLTVEFKEKYTSKIDRDIVAFANSKGGYILLGVDDKGKIKGESLTNKTKAELNAIARNCEPGISIKSIKQIDKVVIIEVQEGHEKPYSCSSGYYRRLDAVTQKMTQREVRSIFRETENISFESLPCAGLSLRDISVTKTKAFLKEAKTSYKISKDTLHFFLTSLRIYKNKKINNAGALMFSSKVKNLLPHTESILGAFKGTDKTNIYDRKDVQNDLLTQYNDAEDFLKKHLNVRSEIKDFDRTDIYELPLDALREAIVNAIVHRDYSIQGTSIYVRIFDNRIEIENPGGFPSTLPKEYFGKSSFRRNPIIADLFHRMKKVEKMGSGIDRMRDLMHEAGLQEPVFETDTFFCVTFYRDPRYALKGGGHTNDAQKVTEKVTQKVTEKVTDNQKGILSAISRDQHISAKKLSEIVGISERKIKENIKKLKDKGFIKRIGPAKGGYWEINTNMS